jgi:hypothetical protein
LEIIGKLHGTAAASGSSPPRSRFPGCGCDHPVDYSPSPASPHRPSPCPLPPALTQSCVFICNFRKSRGLFWAQIELPWILRLLIESTFPSHPPHPRSPSPSPASPSPPHLRLTFDFGFSLLFSRGCGDFARRTTISPALHFLDTATILRWRLQIGERTCFFPHAFSLTIRMFQDPYNLNAKIVTNSDFLRILQNSDLPYYSSQIPTDFSSSTQNNATYFYIKYRRSFNFLTRILSQCCSDYCCMDYIPGQYITP